MTHAETKPVPRLTPEYIDSVIAEEHYFTPEAVLDAARFDWLLYDHDDPQHKQACLDLWQRLPTMSLSAARRDIDTLMGRKSSWSPSLGLMTVCALVLRNGFTVIGWEACASPDTFDVATGRQYAREDALRKVWELEGYLLKQFLHAFQGSEAANDRQA